MKTAAAAFALVGLGAVLAAVGLIIQPYASLPRMFAVPLVVAAAACWSVAGGLAMAVSGRGRPDYRPRHDDN